MTRPLASCGRSMAAIVPTGQYMDIWRNVALVQGVGGFGEGLEETKSLGQGMEVVF